MPPGLGYVHLAVLVEESPDLCPGLQAQKATARVHDI